MRDTSWHAEPLKRSSVQLGWLAVFLACAFVLVALIGYTPADPTRLHPGPGEVSNPCGPVGANVADLLFWGFGYGAWSVFLGMVASVLALAGRPLQPVHEWFLFGIGLFGACGVFALLLPHPGVYGPGGKVGETVVRLFTPWLGTVGTLLVCTSIGVFCLVAVFRISLQQVAARSVAVGESVLSWSGRAVGGAIARSFQGPPELVVEELPEPIDSVLPSRDPAPERLALPPPRYRASPLSAPRVTPDLPPLEPAFDAEILPLVDPSDADVVFETTDPIELESLPYLPPPRRGITPRSISPRPAAVPRRVSPRPAAHRAVVQHVPTPAEVESDSLIGLFPAVGPRDTRRGARMGLVPSPRSVPPRPGQVGERVVETLRDLRLYGRVTTIWEGPVVTTVGFRPERLIDPETVGRRADAIAHALGVEAVRVVEWGGTRDVGIEVPSLPRRPVHLDAVLSGRPDFPAEVPLALGVDVRGAPVFTDLAAMSHLAVVGQPSSGKSNALRSMVSSLIAHPPSRGLALVLMTPEAGLFAPFAGRPELVQDVVRRGR
ncbi:MAG: DNA translocase FtsK 4TM domain-containing protein, partial [Myxococcota bacterium]